MASAKNEYPFLLKNDGKEIHNDVVFHTLFILPKHSYKIIVQPNCRYWRFGIRICKFEDIPFFHPEGRHKQSEDFIDIHLGAGDGNGRNWSNANKLYFVQYNLSQQDHYLIAPIIEYQESSDITWNFILERDVLNFSLQIEGHQPFKVWSTLPVGFEYFKFFAWADGVEFELKGRIQDTFEVEAFSYQNIIFRNGDMFDIPNLVQSDVVILPIPTDGKVADHIKILANQVGVENPLPGELGSVTVTKLEGLDKPNFWGWAYSSDKILYSNLNAIKAICNRLVSAKMPDDIRKVNLPLFGIGAGKLDPLEVAKLYAEILTLAKEKITYIVSIDNYSIYKAVFNEFNKDETKSVYTKTPIQLRDKLNVEPVLGVLDLVDETSDVLVRMSASYEAGNMIGIFGKWGRGKSFFIDKLWEKVKDKAKYKRVNFDAWKYQDTPGIWGYLYEQFANEFFNVPSGINRVYRRIYLNIVRIGWAKFLLFLIPAIITFVFAYFASTWKLFLLLVGGGIISGGILSFLFVYFKHENAARGLFKDIYSKFSFGNLLGIQAEVQKELTILIDVWLKKEKFDRIFLVVEDIDRCSATKIIELIDSLRVMLDDHEISKKVVVIAAIDLKILKEAVLYKYRYLEYASPKEDLLINQKLLTREYLDKLFIFGIQLGKLTDKEKDEFFIELTKHDRDTSTIKPFNFESSISWNSNRTQQNYELEKKAIKNLRRPFYNYTKYEHDKQTKVVYPINKEKIKIANEEFDILREKLRTLGDVTPRQIRIFYYRYLFVKGLVDLQIKKGNMSSDWLTSSNCSLLIDLLINYSISTEKDLLSKHRAEVWSSKYTQFKVHSNQEKILRTADYRQILNALEVAVAY